MLKDDPTIAAVRDARHRISVMVGHDSRKLVEHDRQLQERHRERIVTQSAPRPEAEGETAALIAQRQP